MAESMIEGVDFVAISSKDLPKAVEFYGDTLGLPRSVYLEERNYAEFELGNLTLSVIDADKMGLGHSVRGHHIALHVADVQEARKGLEARGVEFEGDVLDTSVCHMAFFKDPDGNPFMLHNRYAPRPPRS
jgi:catechol 2,3-dioxygenase-like lactoylglutathione lyase family enzyme